VHLVDRALWLGDVFQHLGAEDDIEAPIRKTEGLSVTDDLNAGARTQIHGDSLRKVRGIRTCLRAKVERSPAARVCHNEAVQCDPRQLR
jgi:hypothetical protein